MMHTLAPLMTSTSPEWYTPPAIIADVVRVLGAIDLDPCSYPGSALPAMRHEYRDGLGISWDGLRVYCNPPYGRAIGAWVRKALAMRDGAVILLLPARTDTAWFQPLFTGASLCFVRRRLKFSGAPAGAPFPSALAYRGSHPGWFHDVFQAWGTVIPQQPGVR